MSTPTALFVTSGSPIVGGIYWVETKLLSGTDPKMKRPVVVVALPPPDLPDVRVLSRTSNINQSGIAHPANPALGLFKPGVFAHRFLRSIDEKYFRVGAAVEYIGMLEPEYLGKMMEWWEG